MFRLKKKSKANATPAAAVFQKGVRASRLHGFGRYMSQDDVLVVRPGVAWEGAERLQRWNVLFLHTKASVQRDWRLVRQERCNRGACGHRDKGQCKTSENPAKFLDKGGDTATFHVYQDLGTKLLPGNDQPKMVRVAFAAEATGAEEFAAAHAADQHLLWRTNCMLMQRLVFDLDADKELFAANFDEHTLASEAFCVRTFAPACVRILTRALHGSAVAVARSGEVDAAALEGLSEKDWMIEWTPSAKHKVSIHLYLHERFVLQTDQLRFLFDDEPFKQALRAEAAFLALFSCPIATVETKVFDRAPLNGSMFRAAHHTKNEADPAKRQREPQFFSAATLAPIPRLEDAVRWAALPDVTKAELVLCAHPDKVHVVWQRNAKDTEVNDKPEPEPHLATRQPRTPVEGYAAASVAKQYMAWARVGAAVAHVRFAILAEAGEAGEEGEEGQGGEGEGEEEAGGAADELRFTFDLSADQHDGTTDADARLLCSPGGPFARADVPLAPSDLYGPRPDAAEADVNVDAMAVLRAHLPGGRTFLCPKCVATKGRRIHVFRLCPVDGSLWVKCTGRHVAAAQAAVERGRCMERDDYETRVRAFPVWHGFATPCALAHADAAHQATRQIPINTTGGTDRPLVIAALAGSLQHSIAQSDSDERFGLFVDAAAGGRALVSARRVADPVLARVGSGWQLETQEDTTLFSMLQAQVVGVDGRKVHSRLGGAAALAPVPRALFDEMKSALLGGRVGAQRPVALPRVMRLSPFPVVAPDGTIHFGRGAVPGTNRVGLGFVPEVSEAEAMALAADAFRMVREAVHTCNLSPPDGSDVGEYKDRVASWAVLVAFCAHGRHLVTSNIPMTIAIAASAGAGKTALCKLIMALCGWGAEPNMLTWLNNEDKVVEQLISLFRSAPAICALVDNVKDGAGLDSPVLEAILTGSTLAYRVYFTQDLARAVLDIILFMSCNDLEVKNAAMFRRCMAIHFGFTDHRFNGQTEGEFLGRADAIKTPLAQVFAHLWSRLAKTSDGERQQLVASAGVRGMFSQGSLSFDVCRAFLAQALPAHGAEWYRDAPNHQMEAFDLALIDKDPLAGRLGALFKAVADAEPCPARTAILSGPWRFRDLVPQVQSLAASDRKVHAAFLRMLFPDRPLTSEQGLASAAHEFGSSDAMRKHALAFPTIASKVANVPVRIPPHMQQAETEDEVLLKLRLVRAQKKGDATEYTPHWDLPPYWQPEKCGSVHEVLRIAEGKKRTTCSH